MEAVSEADEIAAFYAARLDEEEAAARAMAAAFEGVAGWVICENGEFDYTVTAGQLATEGVADLWREDAAGWVARHDPARALRDVAAWRAILADCVRAMSKQSEFNAAHARHGSPFPAPHANLAFRTLRSLASAYDAHPDCKEVWKP